MKLFWIMDWNDGTPERDGDYGQTECAAEWPEWPEGDDVAEAEAHVVAERAAEATRKALTELVQDLPLGLLSNEDWFLKISPHGVILEDEDYDEEAAVRG